MTTEAFSGKYTSPPCIDPTGVHTSWQKLYGGILERCDRCGLVATRIEPSFDYNKDYFVGEETGGYAFDSAFSQALDTKRFDAELHHLEGQGLHGSVLDVGCATGTFLRCALARGWNCTGVEIADYARNRVHEELGISVAASLEALPEGKTFDVVTLHHVLEHIHDPLRFVRDDIRPCVGKRLLIEVPNFSSLGSRVHGPRWRDLRPDQHVFHFSPDTLRHMVEEAGLEVIRVTTLSEPLWSLYGTLYTLALLPGLVLPPQHDQAPSNGAQPAGTSDVSDYQPPTGLKKVATEISRIAMAPLVGALRRAGLAERLVIEAKPRQGH